MARGIDQHDAVLIEETLVALHEDREIAAVLEAEPGATVSQRIALDPRRGVESGAHAGAGVAVPARALLLHVDAGLGPEPELLLGGSPALPPGKESPLCPAPLL